MFKNDRWKVFKTCLLIQFIITFGIVLRAMFLIPKDSNYLSAFLEFFIPSNLGMFALLFNEFSPIRSAWYMGIPALILLFAHPFKPNKTTKVVTILAFCCWALMGLGIAYISV